MAHVTITTIYHTIFMAIIVMIAKGWLYVRNILTKEDMQSESILMGVIYMSYSALFITANVEMMQLVMGLWNNVLHVFIFVYVFSQCIETKDRVDLQTTFFQGNLNHNLYGSEIFKAIQLRKFMIKSYWAISSLFLLNQLYVNGLLPLSVMASPPAELDDDDDNQFDDFTRNKRR